MLDQTERELIDALVALAPTLREHAELAERDVIIQPATAVKARARDRLFLVRCFCTAPRADVFFSRPHDHGALSGPHS